MKLLFWGGIFSWYIQFSLKEMLPLLGIRWYIFIGLSVHGLYTCNSWKRIKSPESVKWTNNLIARSPWYETVSKRGITAAPCGLEMPCRD